MASTLLPEKRKGTKAAAGAASHRKGGTNGCGSGGVAHVREGPQHTWSEPLMEACLACDVAAVRELIERGADPVKAREVPPMSYYTGLVIQQLQLRQQCSSEAGPNVVPLATDQPCGDASPQQLGPLNSTSPSPPPAAAAVEAPDSLPPLAAMLLSGLNTPAALEVMQLLMQHGASVNDTFSFSTPPVAAARSDTNVGEDESGGGAAYGGSASGGSGRSKRSHSTAADLKGRLQTGKGKLSAAGVAPPAARASSAAGFAPGGAAVSPPEAPHYEESTVVGSVLHYVVAHGDHAQLMRLLLAAATAPSPSPSLALPHGQQLPADEPRAGGPSSALQSPFPVPLPYSLLPAVEAETVVGALWWYYLQRAGGAADAAGLNGLPSLAISTGAQQPRKSRAVSNAATAPVTLPATAVLAAQAAAPVSACSLVSPSAAEAVLAALQQLLLQRRTSTGGYRGLPILMSAYPQQQQKAEGRSEPGVEAAAGSTRTEGAVAPAGSAATVPCQWWNLASLCDVTGAVSAKDFRHRALLDLGLLDSCGRSAAALALERGDALSVRLLSFFGAHAPFDVPVSASQTRLARACTHGDVARVEALLRQGDSLTQISADGRYTLVHYAAAQPSVLRTLVAHGLSMEIENAFGESALVSLLRHGTARNDSRYVQTLLTLAAAVSSASTDGAASAATASLVNSMSSTTAANAVRFAQLSAAAQRNMILCPPAPMAALIGTATGTAAAHLRAIGNNVSHSLVAQSATGSNSSGGSNVSRPSARQSFLGGREVGTWWSFLPPTATTADVLDTLLRAGAVMHGFVPDEELDLPYVLFAERQASARGWSGCDSGLASAADEDDKVEDEGSSNGSVEEGGSADGEDDYRDSDNDGSGADTGRDRASHRPLSASGATITPALEQRFRGKRRPPRSAPMPARLPMRLTPLQHAIVDYHPELIRRLLIDYRVDPMHRDSQGATAIHYAALCTHAQSVLELLLSPQVLAPNTGGYGKGRPNTAAPDAFIAAASAAATGPSGIHIDLNAVDMAGRTPLFYAAYIGNTTAVQLLMRFGGAMLLCGKADKDGYTPLHVAVQQQHADIAELLIRHSNQLLSSATGGGRGQPADIFAELAATTNSAGGATGRPSRGGARRASRRGSSSTSLAANGHHSTGGLLSAGMPGITNPELLVNVEAEERVTHMTALEMAIKAQDLQKGQLLRIASVLLTEAQASPLRPSGLPNGGALVHRTVADGAVEMTELLLSHFADPNEVDDANETPLFLALRLAPPAPAPQANAAEELQQYRRRRASLLRVLLQYGATPYAQSGVHLQTPMHLAASSLGDADEVIQLIFYSVPDTGGSIGVARRRREQQKKCRAGSHTTDGIDGSSPEDTHFLGPSEGGSSSARRRRSSSVTVSVPGRKSLFERRIRDRRSQQQQQQRRAAPPSSLQGRASSTSPVSRRKPWKGADALSENERSGSLVDLDGLIEDQASLAESSFGARETHNSSFASVEQASPSQSLTRTAEEPAPQDEHERLLQRLAQWQCADHLLEPEKYWMLTDAQGRTPLHILCSRASHALQRMPAVLRLLEDLQAVTRNSSAIAAMEAGILDGAPDDDHVLKWCWRLPDARGCTPLHAAAKSGFVEAVGCILQQSPRSAFAVDMQGRTPLHDCMLMAPSATAGAAVSAEVHGGLDEEAQHKAAEEKAAEESATRLRRMLSLLRSAVAAAEKVTVGTAKSSVSLPLQGTPLRLAAVNVLPSLSMKTIAPMRNAAAPHSYIQRAVASLVQPSSITAELQRWQQSRHWGCPALAVEGIGSGGASTSPIPASEWKAYAQLPDGQGRTALLLAAEVGNAVAARELLKTF
ncbi:hypothetical protein LSCM1_07741 [Leishmania martiniquensis]|uniref:Ankyrin repeat protein n=1 Tax=Leishmania martiniquensis TaxID=1580590 RepID=A0A836KU49_9TRYP|nr:hypothetical protein LSCM1_07741 [Leishmania martiniquensis]